MGIVTTDNKYYSDIADAIREKNGESTLYLPSEMAPAILAIEGNSGYTVTVRNCGANATVTAKHGNRQDTVTADSNGTAVFDDLTKGVWVFMTEAQEKTFFAEILTDVELDFNVTPFNPSPNGLIICTTLVGSTITATNGTTTFKADKTLMGDNEIHVISIKPEYFSTSPITVTCVKADGSSDTQETIINIKKDVELNFAQLWLYRNGNEYTEVTGGWNVYNYAEKHDTYMIVGVPTTVSSEKSGVAKTNNKIAVSKYEKLCCELTDVTNSILCGITTNESTNGKTLQQGASIAQTSIEDTVSHTILEVAIPTGTDDVYIWVGEYTTGKKRCGTLVSVWLE